MCVCATFDPRKQILAKHERPCAYINQICVIKRATLLLLCETNATILCLRLRDFLQELRVFRSRGFYAPQDNGFPQSAKTKDSLPPPKRRPFSKSNRQIAAVVFLLPQHSRLYYVYCTLLLMSGFRPLLCLPLGQISLRWVSLSLSATWRQWLWRCGGVVGCWESRQR